LSRSTISGMEVPMDPRSSTAMFVSNVIPDQIYYMPWSESFDSVFAHAT
jgi:hypothetical protein